MFSVSAEIYEVLALALRYVFAFLGILIVLRTWVHLLSHRREQRKRLRHLPDAGMIGEMVVLSDCRDLPADTRLPVPREGVLGSIRFCDLIVPCEGVRKQHLDFSWQDSTGLLIHPRSGCEALVDGVPLSCRSDPLSAPLRNGSLLQVGAAQLRLLVFVGLDASLLPDPEPARQVGFPCAAANRSVGPQATGQIPAPSFSPPQETYAGPGDPGGPAWADPSLQNSVVQDPGIAAPSVSASGRPLPEGAADSAARPREAAPRRRRSDRWKEDWSE